MSIKLPVLDCLDSLDGTVMVGSITSTQILIPGWSNSESNGMLHNSVNSSILFTQGIYIVFDTGLVNLAGTWIRVPQVRIPMTIFVNYAISVPVSIEPAPAIAGLA